MSFPSFPNITSSNNLSRDQVANLLLASIAIEELALAHIINAEGEMIQAFLGTLPGQTVRNDVDIADIERINRSVSKTLRDVINKELLLESKLENILGLIGECVPPTQEFHVTGTGRTGTLQSFTVPAGVCAVRIQAVGAAGGAGSNGGSNGGLGASIQGTFSVTPGETLSILVGQKGVDGFHGTLSSGGGGGGSFVGRGTDFSAFKPGSLLIAAGGGGGGGIGSGNGGNAQTGLAGASVIGGGSGGKDGYGGGSGFGGSGGGAGIIGNGAGGTLAGQAISIGGVGGTDGGGNGGFGGGGAAAGGTAGGGGGGGFSGGGAGGSGLDVRGGGGGGSFNGGVDQLNQSPFPTNDGNGFVVITTFFAQENNGT